MIVVCPGSVIWVSRRVTQDKSGVKQYGRLLGKVTHSNPLPVLDIAVEQVQAYDNMIPPVVESFKFLSQLTYDSILCTSSLLGANFCGGSFIWLCAALLRFICVGHLDWYLGWKEVILMRSWFLTSSLSSLLDIVIERLSGTRQKLKPDGTNVAQWLQNLAMFTGRYAASARSRVVLAMGIVRGAWRNHRHLANVWWECIVCYAAIPWTLPVCCSSWSTSSRYAAIARTA